MRSAIFLIILMSVLCFLSSKKLHSENLLNNIHHQTTNDNNDHHLYFSDNEKTTDQSTESSADLKIAEPSFSDSEEENDYFNFIPEKINWDDYDFNLDLDSELIPLRNREGRINKAYLW